MEQVQARTASPKHSRNSKPEQLIQARAASPKQRSKSNHNRSPRQNSQRNFIFSLKQVQAREARPQQSSKSPAAQPVQSQHQSKTGFRVDIFSQEQVPASAASPQQSSNSKPEQQVQARAASPKQSIKSPAAQHVQSEQKSKTEFTEEFYFLLRASPSLSSKPQAEQQDPSSAASAIRTKVQD